MPPGGEVGPGSLPPQRGPMASLCQRWALPLVRETLVKQTHSCPLRLPPGEPTFAASATVDTGQAPSVRGATHHTAVSPPRPSGQGSSSSVLQPQWRHPVAKGQTLVPALQPLCGSGPMVSASEGRAQRETLERADSTRFSPAYSVQCGQQNIGNEASD